MLHLLRRSGPTRRKRLRRDPSLPLVFLHVPKCAGTALVQSIKECLETETRVHIYYRCTFGAFTAFETIDEDVRQNIVEFDWRPSDKTGFVAGHFSLQTAKRIYAEANRFLIVREPRSRLLSHWLYWRQCDDDALAPLGSLWGENVRRARDPFLEFLLDRNIACQTDNLLIRMLMWPDPRIPNDTFIDAADHKSLLADGMLRLQQFDFLNFLENRRLEDEIKQWIGVDFAMRRTNETRRAPSKYMVNLEDEITALTYDVLHSRCRIDEVLWKEIVRQRSPGVDADALQSQSWHACVNHHRAVQRTDATNNVA